MKTGARFILEDARITRVKELPKVCFVSLMVQAGKFPDYHEVVLFTPPADLQLEEGLAVTVTGDIQKKKPTNQGDKVWKIEFIARSIVRGDDEKAPRPRRSVDRPPTHTTMPADDVDF